MVDTNVLAVAEGMHAEASRECVSGCLRLLKRLSEGYPVAVDTGGAILSEYVSTLRMAPSSGLATKLAIHLRHMEYDARVCHRVEITPIDDPPGSYVEVPVPLRDFDTDDQKFLAVASAASGTPPVYAGLDGEWWLRREELTACGLDVQFPCSPDLL